jgi:hypothetical protein
MLNFYARKWKEINEEAKDSSVSVPVLNLPTNEKVLASILDINDHVDKICLTNGLERRR